MHIRIVKRPWGQEPEAIRDAWIGLTLPVLTNRPHVVQIGLYTSGVGLLSRLWVELSTLAGRGMRMRGYAVDPTSAIDLLKKADPYAAAWWLVNMPHAFKDKRSLFFEEGCRIVEQAEFDRSSKLTPCSLVRRKLEHLHLPPELRQAG